MDMVEEAEVGEIMEVDTNSIPLPSLLSRELKE
jgi:hypothetical protein